MKKLLFLFLPSFMALAVAGQEGSRLIKDANASVRKVSGFHGIEAQDGIDLYLSQGDKEAVAVSSNKTEYRDKIVTVVENGILKIYYKKENGLVIGWRDRKLRAYVSVKNLDLLHASGGADVIIDSKLNTAKLDLRLSGGSDFVGEVVVSDQLEVHASGGSDVTIKGTAKNLKLNASGGSDYIGYGLEVEYAVVDVNGGSDAQLNVSKELWAEASGGSDVYYKGNPDVRKSSSSGGSGITRRNK